MRSSRCWPPDGASQATSRKRLLVTTVTGLSALYIRGKRMGKIRWYKRDAGKAYGGMMVLTLEERGAYNTVLDLIYMNDGAVADDEREMARRVGCDVRVWRRVRARLIELEKLYVVDGTLHNPRADIEVQKILHEAEPTSDGDAPEVRRTSGEVTPEVRPISDSVPKENNGLRGVESRSKNPESRREDSSNRVFEMPSRAPRAGRPNYADPAVRRAKWMSDCIDRKSVV